MAIAHIIVEIEESPEANEFLIRMTYSGGNDLQNDSAKAAFDKTLEAVQEVLEG